MQPFFKSSSYARALAVLAFLMGAYTAASAQNFSASGALTTADGIISGIKDIAFHVVAGIIGLISVALLGWQGGKYLKGDPQFKDSLLTFGGGLLVIAILMEVIKAIF